ncbi:SCO-spondin-like isoform X8 [Clytia hemisphaerica]|uniref:SCO-spondin-like isoform X8 n=1 Tax=Clytia hemisphaerica TaxID=252671 RepID=UPI0034D4256B
MDFQSIFIIVLGFMALSYAEANKHNFVQCKRTYKKIGCFSQAHTISKIPLLTYRDETSSYYNGTLIDWANFKASLHSLACECHEIAKKQQLRYFAIRYWGECWGGKDTNALDELVTKGHGASTKCANVDYQQCTDHSGGTECVGQEFAEYMYLITDESDTSVNGGYTEWTEFSKCSLTCGIGVSIRERTCTNPMPKGNGKDCTGLGPNTETRECKLADCPIDGGYTQWSMFEQCSVSCGIGVMKRSRYCTNPRPEHGGKMCSDGAIEIEAKPCRPKECPVNGGLSEWSTPSSCSVTCGEGEATQTRTCTNPAPAHGGNDCEGDRKRTVKCNAPKLCPVDGGYTEWSMFGPCSSLCGLGTQTRSRNCTNPIPMHGGKICADGAVQVEGKSCKLKECPVDGQWGPFTKYSECSASCGFGNQTRSRRCDNPAPQHGGDNCLGDSIQSRACKVEECPVNGAFTQWSLFSACSKTCGEGVKSRTRSCTNPEPQHGGDECNGPVLDEQKCKVIDCPVDGGLSSWSIFGQCSKTCGKGVQSRSRSCTNPPPAHNGKECDGDLNEQKDCFLKPCPIDGGYSDWSEFGECSKTCGGGVQKRTRLCNWPAPQYGGKDCQGPKEEEKPCSSNSCPVDGQWGPFTKYSECSASCGFGNQTRSRRCDNPAPQHDGDNCLGDNIQSRACKVKECPVDGGFTNWSPFTACSRTCGDGTQERTRSCTNPSPAHGGKECVGNTKESRQCKVKECPVDGGLTQWTPFGQCSTSCGDGMQSRTRSCTNPPPAHNGKECDGDVEEYQECKLKECPVDGGYSSWSSYSECSEPCGDGLMTRKRTCTNPSPAHGGKQCQGATIEEKQCKVKECPVDGGYSSWSSYSECSEACGDGLMTRKRTCTNPSPAHGGKQCQGASTEEKQCKVKECPVNGGFSEWSSYGVCSKTCGGGTQERKRECNTPKPAHGGENCKGETQQSRTCKLKECPVDGGVSQWSAFSKCSKSCGVGEHERTRTCTNPPPQHGGKECDEDLKEVQECQIKKCPVNGGYSDWSEFGECSTECGPGVQSRERECNNPSPAHGGKGCVGEAKETRKCEDMPCPVDGGYSSWSSYSECSEACGDGLMTRKRTCTNPSPAHGGKQCQGASTEEKQCKVKECPVDGGFSSWSSYSKCSEPCGEGEKTRSRTCTNPSPAHGGKDCSGSKVQVSPCKVKECPVDGGYSSWSSYSECSKACGDGLMTRKRTCTKPSPAHGGKQCQGASIEEERCKVKECPVDGGFSSWSLYGECSELCGGGEQERSRTCTNPTPAHGGKDCEGKIEETRPCNTQKCKVDGGYGPWSPYSACSKPCGEGERYRTRKCVETRRDCSGPSRSVQKCKVKSCPVDGGFTNWSPFTACSRTCGVGTQERTRSCTNPSPAHGGKECVGNTKESKQCKVKDCPVDGGYSSWSSYSECSEACGDGLMTRKRTCINPSPAHGGKQCQGASTEEKQCKVKECPVNGKWSSWGGYGGCSKRCGGGLQTRSRSCNNPAPAHSGNPCKGSSTSSKRCNTHECPVNGNWGKWSGFGVCSKKCGGGTKSRSRRCNNSSPAHGGRKCSGSSTQSAQCNTQHCRVDGGLSTWSAFSKCSKACGAGHTHRTRSCTNPSPAHGGKGCEGALVEKKSCKVKECPVNGNWGSWGSYGSCDNKCGGGVQERFRYCNNPAPAHGGKGCPGYAKMVRACNTHKCPVNGNWGKWGGFSSCNKRCGGGVQTRYRSCNNPTPAHGGKSCPGSHAHSQSCNTQKCPVNGNWGKWGGFSSCNKRCGGGLQTRYRSCNNPSPAHGGKSCPGSHAHSQYCNTQKCPVNGNWGKWGGFSSCNKRCGGGLQTRYRSCNNPTPAHGGKSCPGSPAHSRSCNTQKCPVNGNWGKWGGFSSCNKRCGGGLQTRYRSCNNPTPAHGGKSCPGSHAHSQSCNTHKCPVNGNWGSWGSYGSCNNKCGGGVQERFRYCNNPAPAHGGKGCPGYAKMVRACNTHKCPVNGDWGKWGGFNSCNKRCGGGLQTRYRSCNNPTPAHGGKSCPGSPAHSQSCNTHKCPVNGNWGSWGSYGSCNNKCGGGVQERFRYCNNPAPAHGGKGCPGYAKMVRACNTHKCPVNGNWGKWGGFSSCNKRCGGGLQTRYRSCNNPTPAHGGKSCPGSHAHSQSCNTKKCPVNGKWGSWGSYGSCNNKCGGGVQERFRYCNNPAPAHGGSGCPGYAKMVRACNTHKCPVRGNWARWATWGSCSKACGNGERRRYRACNNPAPAYGGPTCPGSNVHVQRCNTHGCRVNGNWGSWGSYGSCNNKCGGGVQERFRYCNNPSPAHGGSGCPGYAKMVRACNTQRCSGWSGWGSWGACTLPCNGGIRFRFRNCPQRYCPGSQSSVGVCNLHRCSGK